VHKRELRALDGITIVERELQQFESDLPSFGSCAPRSPIPAASPPSSARTWLRRGRLDGRPRISPPHL